MHDSDPSHAAHDPHARGHDHAEHDHAEHDHAHMHMPSADADRRYLSLALAILVAFMAVEVVIGIAARSLALISDAGHMLSDAAALGMSLFAMQMARRPARGHFTYGFRRIEILAAQANGITLVLLAIWFLVEAVGRFRHPPEVNGPWVFVTALAGIAVNVVLVWILAKADRRSLNIEGSYQHILTDLYAFIATAVAGALVWATGWNRADAVAAAVVAWLMLRAGFVLIRESGRVFMEAAPRGIDPIKVRDAILEIDQVTWLADLHIWELTSGVAALSAQIAVEPGIDCHAIRRDVARILATRFAIRHATLQTEHAPRRTDGSRAAPCAQCEGI